MPNWRSHRSRRRPRHRSGCAGAGPRARGRDARCRIRALVRRRHVEPGIWLATTVVDDDEVDGDGQLDVPEGVAPPGGRRSARLEGHDRRAARRAIGLEAALIDHETMTIAALEPIDSRRIDAEVAGSAALLVAKAHKLYDRLQGGRPDRVVDKDAADVVRLFQTAPAGEVVATMRMLVADSTAGRVTTDALGFLTELFGRRGRPGIASASRALRLALAQEAIETLCVAYTHELAQTLR